MNTLRLFTSFPYLAGLFLSAPALYGQPSPSAASMPAPLGLLRLKGNAIPTGATPLAADRFAVDDLSAAGVAGANKASRSNVDYLTLEAGREWSRPLRGSANDVTFVSFQVYASQTTIIDLAGARLGVVTSPVAGGLQLMYDDSATGTLQWKTFNCHVGTGKYGGKALAAFPTLTIRLDPVAGTWDLYYGSRLLADHLPLIEAKKTDRRFVIRAGSEGVWVTGLVLADENPIYEDANANGVDDRFEVSRRGALLPTTASKSERQALAQQWREAQRVKPPPALFLLRPAADNVAASAPKS